MSEQQGQQKVQSVELYAGETCIKRLKVGEAGVVWIYAVPQPDGTLHVIWRVSRASYGLRHRGPYLAEWRIEEGVG